MEIAQILKSFHVIAVVGCSRETGKDAHDVPAFLKSRGYRIIPVNPFAEEILGEKCYKSLLDVNAKIDIVEVFRPGAEAFEITRQAVQKGAKVVWLQEGIVSEDAKNYAEQHGLIFVQDRCMLKETMKLEGVIEDGP